MLKTPLQKRIDQLIALHGSLRAVSRATKISLGYLWRMHQGRADPRSRNTLEKLGLERVETVKPILGKPCG